MATTTTITQPSPILEGSLTAFLKHLDKLQASNVPDSRFKTVTDPDGTTRQVFTGIDTSAYAPKVAPQHALQTGAVTDAAGLGSLVGPGAELAGDVVPGSVQAYMSPYQQQVIDAQMQEFDRQAAINRQGIRDQAIQMGAFGGGREGVQLAEYQRGSDMNRSLLQGQLLQQGFTDAAARRAADLQAQQGLGTYQQAMGQAQQGYEQAKLDATQIAGREAQFAPFTQLGLVGQQLAQIQPGAFPTQTVGYAPPAAPASPMSQFLTGATGAAGIMGKLGLFG
jgi:hypothetical protein